MKTYILIIISLVAFSTNSFAKGGSGSKKGIHIFANYTNVSATVDSGSVPTELDGATAKMGYGADFFYQFPFKDGIEFEGGFGITKRGWKANDIENTYMAGLAYFLARKSEGSFAGGGGVYITTPPFGKITRTTAGGAETEYDAKDFPNTALGNSDCGLIFDVQGGSNVFFGARGLIGGCNFTTATAKKVTQTEYQLYVGFGF
jgi:hypothetical protein